MTDEEHAKLMMLADAAGLTSSDIVRLLVREAYTLKFGNKAPAAGFEMAAIRARAMGAEMKAKKDEEEAAIVRADAALESAKKK